MEIAIGLLILYVIQAVLIYGMTYGYFKGEFPDQKHRGIAGFMALFAAILPLIGPLLIFFLSECGEYGLRYK